MFQDSLLHPRPPWIPRALAALARHEVLSAEQLAGRFALDVVEVRRAVDALVGEGLLRRLEPSERAHGSPDPALYAISVKGIALLKTHGFTARATAPTFRHTRFHLRHEAERADLGLLLERLDEAGALRLLRWETRAAAIGDVTLVLQRGYLRRVPLVADAFAVVEIAGRTSALLVELDRGTVSRARMRLKLAGYDNWRRCGGPERRFGLTALRVLVLCPNATRLRALQTAGVDGSDGRGSRFQWFALARDYSPTRPESLFERHAIPALRDASPESLYPAPR